MLLDGLQGWKNPANGLKHSRLCERILNTPAKTGILGRVKPVNYTKFVEFSIAVQCRPTTKDSSLCFAPEQIHTPEAVFHVAQESQPGGTTGVLARPVVIGENPSNHVFVDLDVGRQGDVLGDSRTAPVTTRWRVEEWYQDGES